MFHRLYSFLHPDRPGGLHGTFYAIACAVLLLAFGAQQISGLSTGELVPQHPTPVPFRYFPPSAPTHKAPPVHKAPVFSARVGAIPQVYGLRTADTGVDISAAINAAAARYGFSPAGYAALIGTESAFHQYAPHYPIVGAGNCDYSGGLTQITVCTAAGLGVGDGSMSQANINYVFWYEQQDANRDVAFSGLLVSRFHAQACWDFPTLYAAWNLGPGYGCFNTIYEYPTNWITRQAVANYRGWWNWVWAYHVRYVVPGPVHDVQPAPKRHYTFPIRRYEHYRVAHHKKPISPYWHGHLAAAPIAWWAVQDKHGHEVCQGIKRHERWDARLRVMRTDFVRCVIYTWPSLHGSRPRVVRR